MDEWHLGSIAGYELCTYFFTMTISSGALALIPARGGSKGIPSKNLQTVGGKSLVVRSIDAAFGSQGVERVVVSTDDPENGLPLW